MYEAHYQLQRQPFSLLPDPDGLYLAPTHQHLLRQVDDGLLRQCGFIVLTGEPGTGKTALLLRIVDQYSDRFLTAMVPQIHAGLGTIMPLVLHALGLPRSDADSAPGVAHDSFVRVTEYLARSASDGRQILLAVDEAQNLTAPMLEELRLLSNANGKTHVIHLVLAGQSAFVATLQRPEIGQFAQRVTVCQTVPALSEADTVQYVRHRLRTAGAAHPVFTERACRLMHRLTGGVPRLINRAGDAALAYGSTHQLPWITADVLLQALEDGQGAGLLPVAEAKRRTAAPQDEAEERREMEGVGGDASPSRQETRTVQSVDTPVSERYERGLTLKNAGLYKQAIDQFQEAATDPAVALKAYAQIGLCYKLAGRHAEAVPAFRKALSSSAASPKETVQILYVLGRSLEALGRTAEALEAYRWIRRELADYRDVVHRIETLSNRRTGAALSSAASSESSWIGSLLKSKHP
jgi:type II secretory pathway predicted ATPase ExeA